MNADLRTTYSLCHVTPVSGTRDLLVSFPPSAHASK